MCHLCAVLNGVAGIVVFSAPSAVSAAWFPPEERTTATGIALVLNNLGNAASFLGAPAIVPDPPEPNSTHLAFHTFGRSVPESVVAAEDNSSCPAVDPDVKAHIEGRVATLMYTGEKRTLNVRCSQGILLYFTRKPIEFVIFFISES